MKTIVTKILQGIKSIRPVISFDQYGATSIAFELDKKIQLNNEEIETRINQLDDARKNLIMAADAIQLISEESKQKKIELDELRLRLAEINKDKETIEKVLQIDQDSFSRLLISTNKKTEKRSILIGIVIGFLTGTVSSYLVWNSQIRILRLLTPGHTQLPGRGVANVSSLGYLTGNLTRKRP